jgi:membrane fusion protein, multidrug efflux system
MKLNTIVVAIGLSLFVVNSQAGATNAGSASSSNNSVNKIKTTPLTSTKKPEGTTDIKAPAAVKAVAVAAPTSIVSNPVRVLLIPERETTIASTMAARIITFNGTLGQSFRAGDTLVAFDCEEAQARVEMSKAELSGAIEQHEAKVKMQGLEQASDVEVALAASASNKAKAQLNLNQAQVGQCKIYAPWAGRVAKANVKNHMTVTPGQPLMELVNSGPLKLKMNLPSSMLARTKVGTKFNITIDETAQTYPATVSALNSRVDPVSQTVEIEAKMLKSYKELLAGMSGVASF